MSSPTLSTSRTQTSITIPLHDLSQLLAEFDVFWGRFYNLIDLVESKLENVVDPAVQSITTKLVELNGAVDGLLLSQQAIVSSSIADAQKIKGLQADSVYLDKRLQKVESRVERTHEALVTLSAILETLTTRRA
jgi:hypothetical protein